MGFSLNEHIWRASPPKLLSEDVSGQQSTSVTQSAARDWLAPKTSTPTTSHCAKCTILLSLCQPNVWDVSMNQERREAINFMDLMLTDSILVSWGHLLCKEISFGPYFSPPNKSWWQHIGYFREYSSMVKEVLELNFISCSQRKTFWEYMERPFWPCTREPF